MFVYNKYLLKFVMIKGRKCVCFISCVGGLPSVVVFWQWLCCGFVCGGVVLKAMRHTVLLET